MLHFIPEDLPAPCTGTSNSKYQNCDSRLDRKNYEENDTAIKNLSWKVKKYKFNSPSIKKETTHRGYSIIGFSLRGAHVWTFQLVEIPSSLVSLPPKKYFVKLESIFF